MEATPLRFGSPQQFANVRKFLQDANFNDAVVQAEAEKLKRSTLREEDLARQLANAESALSLMIGLFVLEQRALAEDLRSLIPESVLGDFFSLGLLTHLEDKSLVSAPVALCPVESVYCVADQWFGQEQHQMPAEPVYPPNTDQGRRLLAKLPDTFSGKVLDLGSGSGFFAFRSILGGAEEAWATDILERATQFAEFGKRLNNIEGVVCATADLFSAAKGETFDTIIAHVPYVPTLKRKWAWHSGGEDGEELTGRILSELPNYLRPGGRLYCKALGTDREQPFELRIRQWLGERQSQFDVLVAAWEQHESSQFLRNVLPGSDARATSVDRSDYLTWLRIWKDLGIQQVASVLIVVQRLPESESRGTFTTRRTFSPKSNAQSIDWLLEFESNASQPDWTARLLTLHPRVSPYIELLVKHHWKGGRLLPSEYKIHTEYPFLNDGILEPWMTALFEFCDGLRTTSEILRLLKENNIAPAQASDAAFLQLITAFVSRGFLELDQFNLPEAAE